MNVCKGYWEFPLNVCHMLEGGQRGLVSVKVRFLFQRNTVNLIEDDNAIFSHAKRLKGHTS